jgi:hypothetical protein
MPTCPAKPGDEGMNYLSSGFLGEDEKGPGPSRTPADRHDETILGKRRLTDIILACI